MVITIETTAYQNIRAVSSRLAYGKTFSLSAGLYVPSLIRRLYDAIAPFHPRGTGNATETIFDHTVKDFIVLHSILSNHPENITVDKITFPPLEETEPYAKLGAIVTTAREKLSLDKLLNSPSFARALNVFILYHDIGKTTASRVDHERIGYDMFLAAQSRFRRTLTDNEIRMVAFMIKYHGLYAQIDVAKRKSLPIPNYDRFVQDLKALPISDAEKANVVRTVFLFNISEGLQSDIFSQDFYRTYKLEDILHYYDQVVRQLDS